MQSGTTDGVSDCVYFSGLRYFAGRVSLRRFLEPSVREFVPVIVDQFEKLRELLSVRAFHDPVGFPVPLDDSQFVEHREMVDEDIEL